MSDDPWALFGEEEVEEFSSPSDIVPKEAADLSKSDTLQTTLSESIGTIDISARNDVATDDEFPMVQPAPSSVQLLSRFCDESLCLDRSQQIPLLTVLHTFLIDHCKFTINDLPTAGGSDRAVNAVGEKLKDALEQMFNASKKLLISLASKGSSGPTNRNKKNSTRAISETESRDEHWRTMAIQSEKLVAITWGWMKQYKKWPHITWRECYVMGQLTRCVIALGRCSLVDEAMGAIDMAIILGAPVNEVEGLVSFVEYAVLDSKKQQKERERRRKKKQGAASVPPKAPAIPSIPKYLGPNDLFDLPPIVPGGPNAAIRVKAATNTQREEEEEAKAQGPGKNKKKNKTLRRRADNAGPASTVASTSETVNKDEHEELQKLRAPTDPALPPLSMYEFKKRFVRMNTPCVLVGAVDDWPALDNWRNLEQLAQLYGHRTVPIESGQHLSSTWKESSVKLEKFLRDFVGASIPQTWGKRVTLDAKLDAEAVVMSEDLKNVTLHPSRVAYLAQHGLFEQVSGLVSDISIPEYAGDLVGAVNAWWGTSGTVTRCHYDSYDNILVQVVGYKFIRLFLPKDSDCLYPIIHKADNGKQHDKPTRSTGVASEGSVGKSVNDESTPTNESELPKESKETVQEQNTDETAPAPEADSTLLQGNISGVDVEIERLTEEEKEALFEKYPKFSQAYERRLDLVLGPGDALFMPKGTWHYVRSLSTSMSVNFWF